MLQQVECLHTQPKLPSCCVKQALTSSTLCRARPLHKNPLLLGWTRPWQQKWSPCARSPRNWCRAAQSQVGGERVGLARPMSLGGPTLTLSWTMGIQPSVGFKVPHSVPPPPPPTPTQHTHCHAGQLLASLYCQMGRAEEAMAVLRASMALWFKPAKSEDNEERWVCRRHLCSRSHSAQGPAG